MSLSRLALRLAAVEALNPHASVLAGPWPTLAGNLVYDSRIDPIATSVSVDAFTAAMQTLESKPIVTVYTEEHETSPIEGATYPAEIEIVDLVVQLQIGARGEIDFVDAEGVPQSFGGSTIPATDADAEALIDVLEAQVRRLLDPQSPMASSALFRRVAMERHSLHSLPERAAERGTRLAMRTLKMKFKVRATTWPSPAAPPASGLDALPEPLRTVAVGLAGTAAGRRLAKFAGSMTQAPRAVPLSDIRIATNLDRGAAPASDGVADMVSDVSL
jgi:hypothetical protein